MKTLAHSIRYLTRSKAYTLINLLGLAFSLACCIILMRYIHRELNVDTHCVDRERTYLVGNPNGTMLLHRLMESQIVRPEHIIKQSESLSAKCMERA